MIKWIYGVLVGMLLLILFMFTQLKFNTDGNSIEKELKTTPKYHLQVIIEDTNEYFWTVFQEGAKDAAEEFGVYVEFVHVSQRDTSILEEVVEKGSNARVDGIIMQAADIEKTQDIIENAKKKGVFVLTYENDNFIIPGTPMVGTNSFSIGRMAGNMAVEATDGKADIVIVMNDEGKSGDALYRDLIVQGITDSWSEHKDMKIKDIYLLDSSIFVAESVLVNVIDSNYKTDLIICIDEKSTPGIAQALVDYNMVGDIELIGYGIMPQTAEYIERDVIYGTVCPDGYKIGYNSVKQMTKALDGEQISDYISTELYTVDKFNVSEFK